MKKILMLSLICLFAIKSFGQRIQVEFMLEGKLQLLNDDFSVYFIAAEDSARYIITPFIKNNSFQIPNFKGFKEGVILFKYKDYSVGCSGYFNFNQNIKLVFGFDRKPYAEKLFIEEENDVAVRAMSYVRIHRLEFGEGTVCIQPIRDLKAYHKWCKGLIK